jgi:hypothetical protein
VRSRPSGSVLTPQLHTRADEPDRTRPHDKAHSEDHAIEASATRIPNPPGDCGLPRETPTHSSAAGPVGDVASRLRYGTFDCRPGDGRQRPVCSASVLSVDVRP